MRVCPECGFVDDALWKHSMKPCIDFMKLEDFLVSYPHLEKEIKEKKHVVREPFVYHLTKGGNVERQAIMDNPDYKRHWSVPTEAVTANRKRYARIIHAHKRTKQKQQKLCVVQKESKEKTP